jgi:hypothetical protein
MTACGGAVDECTCSIRPWGWWRSNQYGYTTANGIVLAQFDATPVVALATTV